MSRYPLGKRRSAISSSPLTKSVRTGFVLAVVAAIAQTASAATVTMATLPVIGVGSVDPSGTPINVAVGDRIRYALIVENPTGDQIQGIFTTIFYDPSQLALVTSYGTPEILKAPGFGASPLDLISPPDLKQGAPGELVGLATANPSWATGLGPELAATIEFEVLDNTNPIDVVQGFGDGDPSFFVFPLPTLLVPEPSGGLLIGSLALLGMRAHLLRRPRLRRSQRRH